MLIRFDALLLLILYFNVSSSTKVISSSRTGVFKDTSVVHSESLTSSGVISTVAGSQEYSALPTVYGIAATAAILDSATNDVAIDVAGNVFITNYKNMILKITASTGLITVVAGMGVSSFSGDEGPATAATFRGLSGIAVDKLGNIFVADRENNRIRKITVSTGIITTVAGSSLYSSFFEDNVVAAISTLFNPTDVAVDTYGNIYIADTGNYRVRKVTASTGIITTIAGNGKWSGEPAFPVLGVDATLISFIRPKGLSVDTLGNVFFSEESFNSIYKITASTGFLTLVAGTNNWHYGFNGDDVPATKALLNRPDYVTVDALGNIFFLDNERIRKVTASTGIITTVAGRGSGACSQYKNGMEATSAGLCSPKGTAVDMAGSLYFCDGRTVQKVTFTEVTPSLAVTGAPSRSLAPSSTRSPTAATPISRPTITPTAIASSGVISTVAGSQVFAFPVYGIAATASSLDITKCVAVDVAGNLFITNLNDMILKVTASTGIITVVAGTGVSSFSGDGGPATAATFRGLSGIAVDKLGNIFVADRENNRIRKITVSTGIVMTVAGGVIDYSYTTEDNVVATSTRLLSPTSVAVDTYGNIYIADTVHGRVRKVTASTGIITTIAGNAFRMYAPPTLGVAATASSFRQPASIAVDTLGNVYFTDSYFNSIYKMTASTGLLTLVAGNNTLTVGFNGDDVPATEALLNRPDYVTVDALGNIFFSDTQNRRIRKVTASTGIITTVAGKSYVSNSHCFTRKYDSDGKDATSALLCIPSGVAVDTAGSIYFCDRFNVRKITYSASTPSSVVTPAPAMTPVSSITGPPTAATPPPTNSAALMSPAPAMTPVSSITGSPTAATPPPTNSASLMSPAPVISSSTGSQSSATTHTVGARHLTIIFLSAFLALYLHRDTSSFN